MKMIPKDIEKKYPKNPPPKFFVKKYIYIFDMFTIKVKYEIRPTGTARLATQSGTTMQENSS